MIGALIGDTVGSVFEFNNIKTKEFELFSKNSSLTDDSIMTLAVAEILQKGYIYDREKIIDTLKKWGRNYPNAGYGGYFYHWLFSNNRESYNSYGNGAAMRISPVGWYARTEEEVKDYSRRITEVTHSHPEGIKGAEVTAMCIFYARKGKSKTFIKKYVEQYYDLNFDYEELRKTYYHGEEICQNTVPQAIFCFLISNSFEDCLRITISIGGDCDTTAAISCAIAEAYYKSINPNIKKQFYDRLPNPQTRFGLSSPKEVIDEMEEYSNLSIPTFEEISDETIFLKCVTNDEIQWLHLNKIQEMMQFVVYNNSLLYNNPEILNKLKTCFESTSVNEIVGIINEILKNNEINMIYYFYMNKDEAIVERVKEIRDKEQFYKDLF